MRYSILMIVASIFATQAHAQFFNGNELHTACMSKDTDFVAGYVSGVTDKSYADKVHLLVTYLAVYDKAKIEEHNKHLYAGSARIQGFCIPKGGNVRQVVDIVCKYLADSPAQRQERAAGLVDTALTKAWPCQ